MTDGLLGFLSLPHYFHAKSGQPPIRSHELLSHRYGCYNTYKASDNAYIAVGALENRFWKQLCSALGVEKYGDLQFDEDRREEIISVLTDLFQQRSGEQWERHFENFDACCTRVLSFEEILEIEN